MTLFPRVPLDNVGIAPLTSMFLFDESVRTRIEDFRDEVHDSDGLQIMMDSGEQTWRPLRIPHSCKSRASPPMPPRGFGLVQRSRKFSDYQDLEAQYEKRPSTWIEPTSNWGAGSVQLIEIPSDRETNDNIVAFWRPRDPIPAGKPWTTSYRVRWNQTPKLTPDAGVRCSRRTAGPSWDGKRKLFVIDFEGLGKSTEGLTHRGRHVGRQAHEPRPTTESSSSARCARASSSPRKSRTSPSYACACCAAINLPRKLGYIDGRQAEGGPPSLRHSLTLGSRRHAARASVGHARSGRARSCSEHLARTPQTAWTTWPARLIANLAHSASPATASTKSSASSASAT